tara:strand:+ start:486 stop:875 length:390 start_codon:yes stop_codon:yes gene_type:complete
MKVSELKRIIQPMIKECIREVLLEEGMLSRIVKETAEGLSGVQILKEQKQSEEQKKQRIEESHKKNIEARKKLLDSIGTQKFGGVDVFENTSPMPAESSGNSPLSGQDPNDAGVDISALPGMKNWGKLL